MTELGRSARWGTAALVAPLAAAALAAATSWGIAHPPAASGKNPSTQRPSDDDVAGGFAAAAEPETDTRDKSLLALQATAAQARVLRLQTILNRLNAQTRAVAHAPIPGLRDGSSAGGAMSVASSGRGGVAVPTPPYTARASAPAAPPTHTSTGAS